MPASAFPILRKALSIACLAALLSSCGSRPSAAVLDPVAAPQVAARPITFVAATNRTPAKDGRGYDETWAAGSLSVERYTFSVPLSRRGTEIDYPAAGQPRAGDYFVRRREKLAPEALVDAVTVAPQFDGAVAIFVHGFNNSYQEALYRTAQMAADVTAGGSPLLFAWPSAGSVMGYVSDREAALASRGDLASVITALDRSPRIKRIILLGHSMGGFLSMEAARQLRLEGRDRLMDKLQIILASPDIDVDVFRSQLRDIGATKLPITLLVSKSDRALIASSFLAGERERVGKVDIDDPAIQAAAKADRLRVIDISALQSIDGLGHDRFATFARFGGLLVRDEQRDKKSLKSVGAFVFDAAGGAVSSPFRAAGRIVGR